MRPEARKCLYDLLQAGQNILRFSEGKDLPAYSVDDVLRSAVERQFEILGEALNRLTRIDPAMARQIPDRERIIAFRNVLAHGYDTVDDTVVWDIVRQWLPHLLKEATRLLEQAP